MTKAEFVDHVAEKAGLVPVITQVKSAGKERGNAPNVLRAMLAGLSAEWTDATEGPETWSPFVIVGHLIHGERADWIQRAEIILDWFTEHLAAR